MANIFSELALEQDIDELLLQNAVHSFVCDDQAGLVEEDYLVTNNGDVTNATTNNKKRKGHQSSAFQDENNVKESDDAACDEKSKRIKHRDIERKRRQEMATLFASLRDLLPLVQLKGTRSSSDIILAGVNYIKTMQKNIEELRGKRDKLIAGISSSDDVDSRNRSVSCRLPINVTARSCCFGIEILISSNGDHFYRNDTILLSKVLEVAVADGLNVVNCVTTKAANGGILHRIVSEVGDEGGIDTKELQQKLRNIINHQISSESG